jgi:hypothetical protein
MGSGYTRGTRQLTVFRRAGAALEIGRVEVAALHFAADAKHKTVAELIADAVKSSERRVVEHLGRVVRLINMKANARDETARLKNFHHRLCAIESELRQMGRKT